MFLQLIALSNSYVHVLYTRSGPQYSIECTGLETHITNCHLTSMASPVHEDDAYIHCKLQALLLYSHHIGSTVDYLYYVSYRFYSQNYCCLETFLGRYARLEWLDDS